MKVTKLKAELNQLNVGDLKIKLDQLRRELFTLRLNSSTAHVKDYSQFIKLRRTIARVLTQLRAKEQAE
ncbi:MAG TPA: 50S ribosomal protein L29 [Candidatus Dependentiae bacterium]|nr:50S ribosomal protein L29 [Candidatus Dependentiae bacterium]HRQ62306.1 50S ribosomal protein L29 [Candidatus Dependentiae bacterium]